MLKRNKTVGPQPIRGNRKGSIAQIEFRLESLHNSFDYLDHKSYEIDSLWFKIPFVNVMWDVFLSKNQTPDTLSENLNVVALISALFATIAAAIPMSVSFEEIQTQLDMFMKNESEYSNYYAPTPDATREEIIESVKLSYATGVNFITVANLQLMCSCIIACVLIVILKATGFRGPANLRFKISETMFDKWFHIMRFPYAVIVLILISGSSHMFWAMGYLYILKFPNFDCAGTTGFGCYYQLPPTYKSPWNDWFYGGFFYIFFLQMVAWGLGSWALRTKGKEYCRLATVTEQLYQTPRAQKLKKFFSHDVLKDNMEEIGISYEEIKDAVLILMESRIFSKETLIDEVRYFDWNDYPDFPIRVKQKLKQYVAENANNIKDSL